MAGPSTSIGSRAARLILLAMATGATDATAFERLGHTFASVITGNLVLIVLAWPLLPLLQLGPVA